MFSQKDLPLQDDVHMLGYLLGEVLIEQEGQDFFEHVETIRKLARARRHGEAGAEASLDAQLTNLPIRRSMDLARAFSAYFGLANLAERLHRIRRGRAYLQPNQPPQPGSLYAVMAHCKAQGIDAQAMQHALQALQFNPVFTAHPTEATRRSLLTKEQRMAQAQLELMQKKLLPYEEAEIRARIKEDLAAAWQTDELTQAPSVADEVEHVMFYITHIIYQIVPRFYDHMKHTYQVVYNKPLEILQDTPTVQCGSWVGGDMDGNPNVGADTILATLQRHRILVLQCYMGDMHILQEHLTQCQSRIDIDSALLQQIALYQQQLPDVAIPARFADMPYRNMIFFIKHRLQLTQTDAPHAYASAEDFLHDLQLMYHSLQQHRGAHAGAMLVQRLMYNVATFGFHLATLDVRQDSATHRAAYDAWLQQQDHAALTHVWHVLKTIGTARTTFGVRAVGLYIISMAHSADDVLALLHLAYAADLVDAQKNVVLDIAPLFETVPDLQHAASILQTMFANDKYRLHVHTRGNLQHVMLGYSDSNKESGLVASRWALQEAQRDMQQVAQQYGIALRFFHGRGGTASRGGSKPRQAILAEPHIAIDHYLRLTEQGEIIHTKYGLHDIALRTLELNTGAILEASLSKPYEVPPVWLEAMQIFASDSRQYFRQLVYDHQDFYTYFTLATPIDVITRLRIGSRPASRRAQQGIEDLRAIPWVFAWTQNRQMLPGWYGVGYGLSKMLEHLGLTTLQQMVAQWPFFANLIADTEMVLAKADMHIGWRYAQLAGDIGPRLFDIIVAEYKLTIRILQTIHRTTLLLDHEPILQEEIGLRNPYVDPISLLQVDLLKRWRAGNRQDTGLQEVLLTTVKGIARGLQNTG